MRWNRFLLGLTLFLLGIGHTIPLRDGDTFWHVVAGQEVWANRTTVLVDHYSFAFSGHSWVYPDWLGGLMLAWVHGVWGVNGLVFLGSFTFLAVYLITWGRCRDFGLPAVAVMGVLFSLFFCLFRFTSVRPQLFGFLFFSAILWIYERRERFSFVELLSIPLLQWYWTNTHRSAFLAPAFFLVATILERSGVRKRTLALFLLVCLATLLHPDIGPAIRSMGPLFLSGSWQASVSEWSKLTPGMAAVMYGPLFLTGGLYLLCVFSGRVDWKLHRAQMVFGLCLMVAGVISHRLLSFGALLFIPPAWGLIFPAYGKLATRVAAVYSAALFAVMLFSWTVPSWAGPLRTFRPGLGTDQTFPKGAADFVSAHLPDARVYNDLRDGGYLLYRFRGKPQIAIDGRTLILYPLSYTLNVVSALGASQRWDDWVRGADVDVAILRAADERNFVSPLSDRPDWPMVFFDDTHFVHVRSDCLSRDPSLRVFKGIDLADPVPSMNRLAHTKPALWRNAEAALESYGEAEPGSLRLTMLRAYAAHLDGKRDPEIMLLRQALKIDPSFGFAKARLIELSAK